MTLAPTAVSYCLMSRDGIVEMRFSTMVKRRYLRVEDVKDLFRNRGNFSRGYFIHTVALARCCVRPRK
jgi:hypothetical protein